MLSLNAAEALANLSQLIPSMTLPYDRFFEFVFGQPERPAELLGYLVSIGRACRVKDASRLPYVIPVIVYHCSTEWQAPAEFSDYFRGTPPFGPVDPQFRPLLIDLAAHGRSRLEDLSTVTRSVLTDLRYAAARRESLLTDALPPIVTSAATGALLDYFQSMISHDQWPVRGASTKLI